MPFAPRRMRVPLITLNIAVVAALWALTAAGFSDRATGVLSSAAGAVTAVSGTAWIVLGAALLRRNRELELIVTAAVEARKRAADDDRPGRLRLIP